MIAGSDPNISPEALHPLVRCGTHSRRLPGKAPRVWPRKDWQRWGSSVEAQPAAFNKVPVGFSLLPHFSAPGTNFYISTCSSS